jgi:hypothetical protein
MTNINRRCRLATPQSPFVRDTNVVPRKLIFAGPPPSAKGFWSRSLLAMSVVLAATLVVALLWRWANWPGSALARALVLGFGTAFGARFGSTGRLRGRHVSVPIVIGAVTAGAFFALNVLGRS